MVRPVLGMYASQSKCGEMISDAIVPFKKIGEGCYSYCSNPSTKHPVLGLSDYFL